MPGRRIDTRLLKWLYRWVEWEYSHLYGRAIRYACESDRRTLMECRTISRGRKGDLIVFSPKQVKGAAVEAYPFGDGGGLRCTWSEEFGLAFRKLIDFFQYCLVTECFPEPDQGRRIITDLKLFSWSDQQWHDCLTRFRPGSEQHREESEKSWIQLATKLAPVRQEWLRMLREEESIRTR